ncbi:MAG: TraB/GumN family protein [Pseudomonadota bacterium]
MRKNTLDQIASLTLKLVGALNLLFAFALIATALSASNASAQSTDACSGSNLFAELAETNPNAFAEIEAEAAATPFSDTLLYRIEKPGVSPSYLFGTMHLTDPRIVELSAKVQKAFDETNTLIIESDEILDMTKAQVALLARPDLQMFTDGQRLSDFIDDDQREALKAGLQSRGLQLALIDRMKPWMVTGLVALPACEMARKQAGEAFLDIALAERAQAAGKEIRGLETIVEQLDAMASLPIEFHVQGLVETVKLGDKMDDIIETMTQLYLDEDIAAVMPTLERVAAELGADEGDAGYAEFEEKIVINRNYTMAERAQPYLDEGGVFLAVGALHLPGDEGVAKLLQDAGYTITPILN